MVLIKWALNEDAVSLGPDVFPCYLKSLKAAVLQFKVNLFKSCASFAFTPFPKDQVTVEKLFFAEDLKVK